MNNKTLTYRKSTLYEMLFVFTNTQSKGDAVKFTFLVPTKKHNTYFEPVWQGAQQLDFDWQANECCHATVGDGGCELNAHSALFIINLRKWHTHKKKKK